ncbi:ABC transporter ATP-binding protein [Propioniciclava sinopodophylli]|uniref:ABC-type quaternary amine transporter n=1 Tax=Propioniciclava sinopodophylli TaxID=1837344 RepID=A0A4Q9KHR3_9ACTN|nr:ABC transporter ATP-binding protein [Propioniciclava sinopodophylli]TBT88592.1 ABC transporter ATP-binding protein [Propioniciclava sinopodophylli]
MVTNRTGLGVHDVVVRYRVSTQQPGYTTPAKRPLFSWAAPKRPAAEPGDGRTVTAVDGVSLDVAPGEVVALLGASGSGKSSLLRAIAGLEPLASGRITWDGEDLSGTPTHKRNFGMMFQDPALFPSLNVGKNVAYGLHKQPRTRRAQTVEKFLDLVGLPSFAGRKTTELSGGQAQRVALARSLAPAPRLLLLDEPLSALDRGLREHMVGVLSDVLRATGTTAVHVTHDQDEAFALADRVAILADGRLLQFDTPENLWSRPASAEVATFLGYSTFLTRTDADALGLGHLTADHVVALGPESLTVDPAGVQLRVKEQKVRRGYVQVTLLLPSGAKAGLRVPEKVSAATVGVRTDPDAVALIG